MSRGLSAAAKTYKGPLVWLADITTRAGAAHFFATEAVSFGGNSYQAYLRVIEGIRQKRTFEPPTGEIELINTDLVVGKLLETEDFEGARCHLRQLLLGVDEAIEFPRFQLSEQEERPKAVRFRLVSDFDPGQIQVPGVTYSQFCTWRFKTGPCKYRDAQIGVTDHLGVRTANMFSIDTIGDITLSEIADAHKDRFAAIVGGLGKRQIRRIRTNSATTFTLYQAWETIPDGTSKFQVVSGTNGLPKILFTSTEGDFARTATGGGARFIEDTGLSMVIDEHKDELVRIISGTGSGQQRKIKSNTATRIDIADAEPDFSPAPDLTSVFRVLHRLCPKDIGVSCEQRGRTEDFNGFASLVALVQSKRAQFVPGGHFPDPLGGGEDNEDGRAQPL